MGFLPAMRAAILACLFCLTVAAQSEPEEYRVYNEHPRLFLNARRLRLLKRERERQSMRWRQLETLIVGKAAMPEPGFAYALYAAVSGNAEVTRRAIEWSLNPAADVRQVALVYDWLRDQLSEAQARSLAARLTRGLQAPAKATTLTQRDRVLAAIALAGDDAGASEVALRDVLAWWRKDFAAALNAGAYPDDGAPLYAVCEMLHALRDNLNIDPRDAAQPYFKQLPAFEVASAYPAPFVGAENEYRVPAYQGSGQPDLKRATLARVAGLSLVAFDTNALENQFLQGWLIQDRFLLRGVLGAPYEFLWANPYQPGLAYVHLPLIFHDARSGALFVRENWDEDAAWFGLYGGEAQLFREGRITVLNPKAGATQAEPLRIGRAALALARTRMRFHAADDFLFVIGARPSAAYDVEVDDEELRRVTTDKIGTLELNFVRPRNAGVRIVASP
jgi:hypothetical protein